MSSFVADPYEIGLLAALVKRIPEANQPPGVRELNVFQVARALARENIASVRADRPDGYVPGTPEGIGRAGPNLFDKDVIALAHDAAHGLSKKTRLIELTSFGLQGKPYKRKIRLLENIE